MQTAKTWLSELLDKNKRKFQIPVYQRNYDWTNVQCEKLFEDILTAYEKDKQHFTGTIVYVNKRYSNDLNIDLIIDGQQRITTLFILIKALYDKAIELNEAVHNELHDLLYNRNCDETFKLKLKPIKSDNEQFELLMNDKIDEMKAGSNILKNYKLFMKLINAQLNGGMLLKEILRGIKKLQVVEIVLDNDDNPQVIFESINSTGLELSLADKIRNFILMNDENQEQLFEDYWHFLEKLIDASNMEDFFVNFLNFRSSESTNSKKAYDTFKKLYYDKGYTNREMLAELKKYGTYYAAFIGKYDRYGAKINAVLRDYKTIDQSTMYPFLFSIFDDYDNQIIDENTLLNVLVFLRSYFVRRLVCEVPSNSLRGLFKTLYSRLFATSKDNYYATIYSFFKTIKSKDVMPEDKEFIQKLKTIDLYNKKKICKYLLATIEQSGSNEILDMTNLSIEHLMPQSRGNIVWKKIIGDNYDKVYDTYLHTLGNLTITGHNSELGTKSFAEKVAIIKDHARAITLNKDIISRDTWDENNIKSRADRLAKLINKILKFEEVEVIQIEKNEDERYSLANISEATGLKPSSFSFVGEVTQVSSFSNMLSKLVEILYSVEMQYLCDMADEKFKMSEEGRSYVSYEKSDLRKGKELGNTGIYLEYNLSATDILKFIKKLLIIHTFDEDDFYYTARV